jgi:HD-like signal output (HDOD) protein
MWCVAPADDVDGMTQGRSWQSGARVDLDALVSEIGELRPLAATARQILRITAEDRFSAYDLAKVIAADQALTAKMLRLANSAYYGFARRITTMRDAVVLLGFREVRAATIASCVIDAVPASRHIDYARFWHYSVSVGMLAELLARAERHETDEAFTAGVLHNIGRLALDEHRPSEFGDALVLADRERIPLHEAQRRVFGFSDAQLGQALAREWDFPEPLTEAVARHYLEPEALPETRSLLGFVTRARVFARTYGISDGVETPQDRGAPPGEWLQPPISSSLRTAGGVDGLMERADLFLEHALRR